MTRWLVCRRRRPDAGARLYCFPHAGGSPGEYVRWSDQMPAVEVWGVQPPGRGSRLAERPFTRIGDLVGALVSQARLDAPPSGPFGFFGHSLGALVAYETALALRAAGRPTPDFLVVSGVAAPHLARGAPPDDRELARHLPDVVREDPELLQSALTTLRADLTAFAAYRPAPAEPLACALVAVGGDRDEITEAELAAWRDRTTGPFRLRLLPGGHFYLREESDALFELIGGAVAA